MKYTVAILALICLSAYANFDFTHHQNGHDLTVSLRDESDKTWVIYMEKNVQGNDKLVKQNKDVKNQIRQRLYNEDVFYTELDLTDPKVAEAYKEFFSLIKLGDLSLFDQGPIVALVYNRKGYWIHGHGIPQETVDTIHAFLVQKEENSKDTRQAASVSFGAPVKHPSAYESFGGGY